MATFTFGQLTNADNVYSSVAPIYALTYISGLTPSFINTQSACVKIIGYILTIIHLAVYIICYTLSIINHETLISYFFNNEVSRFGDFLQVISGFIIVCIIFVHSLWKNSSKTILAGVQHIDNELLKIGSNIHYKKILRFSYLWMIIIFLLNWAYYLGSYNLLEHAGVQPSFAAYTSFFLPYFNIGLVLIIFFVFSKLVRFRISILNKVLHLYLNRLKPDGHSIEIENSNTKTKCCQGIKCTFAFDDLHCSRLKDPIKLVMHIHNLLCDVCEILEDSLGYQMLAIIAVSFLYIIFDGYYILQALVFPTPNGENILATEVILFFAIQLFLYIMVIAGITESSYSTMQENRKSLNLVHKILAHVVNTGERESLIALSLQLVNRDVRFSAAGLFYLDRSLYFTIAGATTTYLIILIQFSSYKPPTSSFNITATS